MTAQSTYLGQLIIGIGHLIGTAIPIMGGLALLLFLWGMATFILKAGDEGAQEIGRNRMIWGIIALFVIFATWGLVALLGQIFGVNTNTHQVDTTDYSPPCSDLPDAVPCR